MPPEGPLLPDGTKYGGWWHETDQPGRVICDLCPRACALRPGDRGFCFVRENRGGQMVLSTYGRSTGFCVDPIEKKPLNHFYPGTSVLSFGTAGCNLGCKFCQNWSISKSREVERLSEQATPEAIAHAACQLGCRSVAFTYNDPVIWAEYAIDVARACQAAGIKTVAVTAGYIGAEARRPFFEVMDAANVDLKGFTEDFYQHLTLSHLQPVLDTLKWLKHESDVWFEITNLVIPRANDSADEIREMCEWVAEHLGPDVPVHFTAFHPDFRLKDRERTPPETLIRAYEIARAAGLNYVYVGNVYDVAHQSTYCPHCGQMVIERDWHEIGQYHLEGNRCRHCHGAVTGHFDPSAGSWGRKRLPVRISNYVQPLPILNVSRKGNGPMSTTLLDTAPKNEIRPPQLTDRQKQAIHHAASELVAGAVLGYPTRLSDPSLAGASDHSVLGCFLTIKRNGRLRGCCGFIGRRESLAKALSDSSVASATRDARLPSISPTELEHLDLTVCLLHSLRPVTARGVDRIAEVEVGRHGLQIAHGTSRGLLLPSVATEHDLNAERFLRQVCSKAGLPPTAWKEDDAQLMTFESESFGGRFVRSVLEELAPSRRAMFVGDQLANLARAVGDNVIALVRGATPNSYLPHCPDGNVNGVTVALSLPGQTEATRFSQLSIRPGFPLQATLFDLAKLAAEMLARGGYSAQMLGGLNVDLTVIYDPAMHGTVDTPDLEGLDPKGRALLVIDGDRTALVFDPAQSGQELLQLAAREARVRIPENASVLSAEVHSTQIPVLVAAVPRPQSGPTQRAPAVAGAFYPGEAHELTQTIDQLLAGPPVAKQRWAAAMVPHAGLMYSGRIAAAVFRRLELPKTIIVIGPKHTRLGVNWSVAPHEIWSLPGVTIPSDPELARQLSESIPDLELDAAAHAKEHAIEVELPFIARLAPESRVVGIAIGSANLAACRQFATGLASVLRSRLDETLLVISTDMNHFANDAETRRVDELALGALARLDPKDVYQTVRDNQISMCGVLPAVIVLETLRELGRLTKCERVGYATSADATGDKTRVVGYAGMLFG
jgi:AmmeMemoRadiSam system radical SAM enzyme/AmmeMemoRadiSam system protein B/AmmeMemoRadiSam system protein A